MYLTTCLMLKTMHRLPAIVERTIHINIPARSIYTVLGRTTTYNTSRRALTVDEISKAFKGK